MVRLRYIAARCARWTAARSACCIKMMNCVLQMMNFASQLMDFVLKRWICVARTRKSEMVRGATASGHVRRAPAAGRIRRGQPRSRSETIPSTPEGQVVGQHCVVTQSHCVVTQSHCVVTQSHCVVTQSHCVVAQQPLNLSLCSSSCMSLRNLCG